MVIDFQQVLQCPSKVGSEDIVNVQGSVANLSEKEKVIPVNSVNNVSSILKTSFGRPKRVKDVTFLGSWPEKKVQQATDSLVQSRVWQ